MQNPLICKEHWVTLCCCFGFGYHARPFGDTPATQESTSTDTLAILGCDSLTQHHEPQEFWQLTRLLPAPLTLKLQSDTEASCLNSPSPEFCEMHWGIVGVWCCNGPESSCVHHVRGILHVLLCFYLERKHFAEQHPSRGSCFHPEQHNPPC